MLQEKTGEPTLITGMAAVDQPSPTRVVIPAVHYHHLQLPKTNLHYLTCGAGPPLIMVPATISKIENWKALAQFMGQRFRVYFFELPGHGSSSPFPQPFSSQLAAETVEDFIGCLGYQSVSLMGFSFGGILTMTTLNRLRERVSKVILLSPVLSRRALKYSEARLRLLKGMVKTFQRPRIRSGVLRTIRNPKVNGLLASTIANMGRVEKSISVREVFQKISDSTADVLSYQLAEMLDFEMQAPAAAFSQPCYFGMSIRDPLLNFDVTLDLMKKSFSQVHVEQFQFPYHQPPKPPTFEEMNLDYGSLLDYVCST